MEVIGIVASLITISELGIKTSQSPLSIGDSLINARQQINDLGCELANISDAFRLLAGILEDSTDIVKPKALQTIQSILDDCNAIYSEIDAHASATEGRSIKMVERVTWLLCKAKVKKLQKRLESAKALLSLVVNILKLGTGVASLK
jgi:hypothetical protein